MAAEIEPEGETTAEPEAESESTVEAEPEEGYKRVYTFQNADVTVPILSTGRMADHDHTSTFKKDGGFIHEAT